jgi:cysteine desulfurase
VAVNPIIHALKGVFFAQGGRSGHIITTQVEHPAVLNPCRFLERLGASVTYLPVDRFGRVDPEDVRHALTPRTMLISVMHSNNEVGTLQPSCEIAHIAHERGILFHSDAAQSAGKIPVGVDELGVCCRWPATSFMRRRALVFFMFARGWGWSRSFTEPATNQAAALGPKASCSRSLWARLVSWRSHGWRRNRYVRDLFWELLQTKFGKKVVLNGHPTERLPNTLNVSFVGKIGSTILSGMQGVAASTGSACHSGSVELSPVLKAMKIPPEIGMGSIRFSLGRTTTRQEIEQVVSRL